MKRSHFCLTQVGVFLIATSVGWLSISSGRSGQSASHEQLRPASLLPSAKPVSPANDSAALVAQLEHKLLHDVSEEKPTAIYDKAGMEAVLASDVRDAWAAGGGMQAIEYIGSWAEQSPDAVFEFLMECGPISDGQSLSDKNDRRRFLVYYLFSTWCKKDMEAALTAVFRIPQTRVRKQALITTLEYLCQSDPVRAHQLLMDNLTMFQSQDEWPIIGDPNGQAATLEMFLSLPASREKTHFLADILSDMAAFYKDGKLHDKALAAWKSFPEKMRRDLLAAGFRNDATKPLPFEGLAELANELPNTSKNGQPEQIQDLPKQLASVQQNLKGKQRVDRSVELFNLCAGQNFDAAVNAWQSLPEGVLKARAAGAMVKGAPAHRKAEAEALLLTLSEHDQRLAR